MKVGSFALQSFKSCDALNLLLPNGCLPLNIAFTIGNENMFANFCAVMSAEMNCLTIG